jgi:hypothetical protein
MLSPNYLLEYNIGGSHFYNSGGCFFVKGVGGRLAISKRCEGINTVQEMAVNHNIHRHVFLSIGFNNFILHVK